MVNQPGFSIARKVRYPLLKTLEARESKEDAERLLREAEVGEFRCKSQQLSSSFGYEAISLKMHIYIRPHVPACMHACMACMHASIYLSIYGHFAFQSRCPAGIADFACLVAHFSLPFLPYIVGFDSIAHQMMGM